MFTLWLATYLAFAFWVASAVKNVEILDDNQDVSTFGAEFPRWNILVGAFWPAVIMFLIGFPPVWFVREWIEEKFGERADNRLPAPR